MHSAGTTIGKLLGLNPSCFLSLLSRPAAFTFKLCYRHYHAVIPSFCRFVLPLLFRFFAASSFQHLLDPFIVIHIADSDCSEIFQKDHGTNA
jgi:hypothetical protein